MVIKCVVRGCKSQWHPGCSVKFHGFPTDISRKKKWLSIIPFKTEYYEGAKICGLHFKDADYTWDKKRLKPTANPFFKDNALSMNFKPVLIEGPTNSGSEDLESDTNNKNSGSKYSELDTNNKNCDSEDSESYANNKKVDGENEESSFSDKDGKITHIYKNIGTLSDSIKCDFDEEIDEYINSAPVDNEEAISDTDSIFDTPRIVELKRQLQKEKDRHEMNILKIKNLKEKNTALRKKNLIYKSLLKCLREKYIPKKKNAYRKIVVEFLPKTN